MAATSYRYLTSIPGVRFGRAIIEGTRTSKPRVAGTSQRRAGLRLALVGDATPWSLDPLGTLSSQRKTAWVASLIADRELRMADYPNS